MLELFSGSGVMARAFEAAGFDTFTIDNEPKFKPDLCADINLVEASHLVEQCGDIDVLWSGQPCHTFSVMSIGRHWTKDGLPKSPECLANIKLHKHALELIDKLCPKVWFIENPRGLLHKQKWMIEFVEDHDGKIYPFTQCQYGLSHMKPSVIMTNLNWLEMKACRNGSSCHVSAPRGAINQRELDGVYPQGLCDFVVTASKWALLSDRLKV
jgi:site-specific DNA-cytosine methylase